MNFIASCAFGSSGCSMPTTSRSVLQADRNGMIRPRGLFGHDAHQLRGQRVRIYLLIRNLEQLALKRRKLFIGHDLLALDDIFRRFVSHDRIALKPRGDRLGDQSPTLQLLEKFIATSCLYSTTLGKIILFIKLFLSPSIILPHPFWGHLGSAQAARVSARSADRDASLRKGVAI